MSQSEQATPKDWVYYFLTTTKLREVDEPLYTALQFTPRGEWLDANYVHDVLNKIKNSHDIHAMRFMWLALLTTNESMKQHCVSNGSPNAPAWVNQLPTMFCDFYSGSHGHYDTPLLAFMDDVLRAYVQ